MFVEGFCKVDRRFTEGSGILQQASKGLRGFLKAL